MFNIGGLQDETYITTLIFIAVNSFIIAVTFYFVTSLFNFLARHNQNSEKTHVPCANENKYGSEKNKEYGYHLQQTLYSYLHNKYWKVKHEFSSPKAKELTEDDLKPVLRIYDKERKIHIIYSKKTVWDLAFSEKVESGASEKFAFIFKGLKPWSVEETKGRFDNVLDDLFQFRQVCDNIVGGIFSQRASQHSFLTRLHTSNSLHFQLKKQQRRY